MNPVGILTEDPRAYFDMLTALREQGIAHLSLDFSEPIPANISVVMTTERERHRVSFDRVVSDDDMDRAVAKVRRILAGGRGAGELTIGIDPGQMTGVAVLADGVVIARTMISCPENIREVVRDVVEGNRPSSVSVRIGNGDRTNRNRIFNILWDMGYICEIVDESNTTKRSRTPHEDAAVEIALTPGYVPRKKQAVDPVPGEIRNIQRLSRIRSEGSVTVSKELAEKVATGDMSMDEAIRKQKKP
ncbi:MAG: hypothetical protein JSV90_00230 [Methanobacteriota archaeon]|nr:MAG: hypothetical protein JSV90_00230 [Euryarchaeota archaeon]